MKKLILIFITIIIFLSMTSCMEEAINNTETNESINENENHSVPYSVSFSSIAEIKDFLSSAKGSSAQYEEFAQKNNINISITQSFAKSVATNIERNDIPLPKSDLVADEFAATYYLNRNELDIIYRINGIRYRFIYKYDETSSLERTVSPVLEDLNLGSYFFDLYQGDECFVGEIVTESAVIQLVVYDTKETSNVNFNAFNMGILSNADSSDLIK